jgi:flavin-dependent dehydrogenase
MFTCDVLVVGGGPAGSTCATRLVQRGLDVAVLDKARFPRDKVCAGWITPAVVDALELDLRDYAPTNVLQPFRAFRTGPLDGKSALTDFGRVVSYGIRRCEFDAYLLRRSGARVIDGRSLESLRREGDYWIANDEIRARVVVGAGGHFCPVARALNPDSPHEDVVVAQEIEFRLDGDVACPIEADSPELYFWPDLLGYGWCVRKGDYLNIGAGRLRASAFPAAVAEFKRSVLGRRFVDGAVPAQWKGHAYLLNWTSRRRLVADGAVLVGDAAGLALGPSGEGILAAIESGALAASAIASVFPDCTADRLEPYARDIDRRFGARAAAERRSPAPWLVSLGARALFGSKWLTRHLLLERAFLHLDRTPLRVA